MVRPSDQTAKKVTHKSMYHTLQSDKKKLIFFYHEVHRSLTMIREMKLVRDTHTSHRAGSCNTCTISFQPQQTCI